MTYIETVVSAILFSLFMAMFSQALFPLMSSMIRARNEYEIAKSIEFLDKSFRKECASSSRNILKWKHDVAFITRLESCQVSEIYTEGSLCAMKANCLINGENIEIIAECAK